MILGASGKTNHRQMAQYDVIGGITVADRIGSSRQQIYIFVDYGKYMSYHMVPLCTYCHL